MILEKGKIIFYRLYDVAYEIDLTKVEETLQRNARRVRIDRKPFSRAFEFSNPPVSFHLQGFETQINGLSMHAAVLCKAYNYGVISIALELPFHNIDFPGLHSLAIAVDESEELEGICRKYLGDVLPMIGHTMTNQSVSRFEEDYSIYYIESALSDRDLKAFFEDNDVAGLLLCERDSISSIMKNDLMSLRFSYSSSDAVVLNFDNALIFEPSGSMEIPDILEFANAQLLELRYYDNFVDRELDYIYRVASKAVFSIWNVRKYESHATHVMKTVTELSEITERIDNALKVTEDVYYAKIYRVALRLFRVTEWEDGIRRKLDLASRSYDMITKGIATKRTELLELTIVLLIIIEIIVFFFLE